MHGSESIDPQLIRDVEPGVLPQAIHRVQDEALRQQAALIRAHPGSRKHGHGPRRWWQQTDALETEELPAEPRGPWMRLP